MFAPAHSISWRKEYEKNYFPGHARNSMLDEQNGRAAAMGNSLPLHWNGPASELPEQGWEQVTGLKVGVGQWVENTA